MPFLISPHAKSTSLWDLDISLHILAGTPEFYQRLIGPLPNINDQSGLEIAHQLELETLLACRTTPQIHIPAVMVGCLHPLNRNSYFRELDPVMVTQS